MGRLLELYMGLSWRPWRTRESAGRKHPKARARCHALWDVTEIQARSTSGYWRITGGSLEDHWRITGGSLEDHWRITGGYGRAGPRISVTDAQLERSPARRCGAVSASTARVPGGSLGKSPGGSTPLLFLRVRSRIEKENTACGGCLTHISPRGNLQTWPPRLRCPYP